MVGVLLRLWKAMSRGGLRACTYQLLWSGRHKRGQEKLGEQCKGGVDNILVGAHVQEGVAVEEAQAKRVAHQFIIALILRKQDRNRERNFHKGISDKFAGLIFRGLRFSWCGEPVNRLMVPRCFSCSFSLLTPAIRSFKCPEWGGKLLLLQLSDEWNFIAFL